MRDIKYISYLPKEEKEKRQKFVYEQYKNLSVNEKQKQVEYNENNIK